MTRLCSSGLPSVAPLPRNPQGTARRYPLTPTYAVDSEHVSPLGFGEPFSFLVDFCPVHASAWLRQTSNRGRTR